MFSNMPPVTKALLIANALVFLLQQLLGDAWQGLGGQPRIEDPASLSNSDKKHNLKDHARKTREQRLADQLGIDLVLP